MRLRMTVVLMAALCCGMANAQMGAGPSAAEVGKPMEPSKALDAMLTQFENDVVPAAKAMPADKYGFAPSAPGVFAEKSSAKFDTVRTFVGQVVHLAQANYYFYGTVSGVKPNVDMGAMGKITDKEAAVKALEASFVFAHKAIATVTPANAFEAFKGADGMNTRATLCAFGVAHGYDHYGQMVEYLRMNGIIPPSSAK